MVVCYTVAWIDGVDINSLIKHGSPLPFIYDSQVHVRHLERTSGHHLDPLCSTSLWYPSLPRCLTLAAVEMNSPANSWLGVYLWGEVKPWTVGLWFCSLKAGGRAHSSWHFWWKVTTQPFLHSLSFTRRTL